MATKFITADGRVVSAAKTRPFGSASSGLMVVEEDIDAPVRAASQVGAEPGVVLTTMTPIKHGAEFVREVDAGAPEVPFSVFEQVLVKHIAHRATLRAMLR